MSQPSEEKDQHRLTNGTLQGGGDSGYDATLNEGREMEQRYLDQHKYGGMAAVEEDESFKEDVYPDGGTQAWLCVLGVSRSHLFGIQF